jgi:hypothetical protein
LGALFNFQSIGGLVFRQRALLLLLLLPFLATGTYLAMQSFVFRDRDGARSGEKG